MGINDFFQGGFFLRLCNVVPVVMPFFFLQYESIQFGLLELSPLSYFRDIDFLQDLRMIVITNQVLEQCKCIFFAHKSCLSFLLFVPSRCIVSILFPTVTLQPPLFFSHLLYLNIWMLHMYNTSADDLKQCHTT
ncbi:uncharacterized protein EV154DRAFT_495061, partial [Mucor mucedo]|uniref:uncharacterized protein n=1 Tax=Mucor mucedo TaxID=29922 RepID=UPI0022201C35